MARLACPPLVEIHEKTSGRTLNPQKNSDLYTQFLTYTFIHEYRQDTRAFQPQRPGDLYRHEDYGFFKVDWKKENNPT